MSKGNQVTRKQVKDGALAWTAFFLDRNKSDIKVSQTLGGNRPNGLGMDNTAIRGYRTLLNGVINGVREKLGMVNSGRGRKYIAPGTLKSSTTIDQVIDLGLGKINAP